MDIGGFRAVRVKFDESCQASHCMYIKKHNVRVESEATPPDRTMFVLNVPPFCNEVSRPCAIKRLDTILIINGSL